MDVKLDRPYSYSFNSSSINTLKKHIMVKCDLLKLHLFAIQRRSFYTVSLRCIHSIGEQCVIPDEHHSHAASEGQERDCLRPQHWLCITSCYRDTSRLLGT